ncbi:hypothetical protein BDQ17DRAFT_1380007 [Cyathus striatus]|nr:hypothetical protein BDQ17DRAFT_1380007 [Cyathus striatus]
MPIPILSHPCSTNNPRRSGIRTSAHNAHRQPERPPYYHKIESQLTETPKASFRSCKRQNASPAHRKRSLAHSQQPATKHDRHYDEARHAYHKLQPASFENAHSKRS